MGLFKLPHIRPQTGPLGGCADQIEPYDGIKEACWVLRGDWEMVVGGLGVGSLEEGAGGSYLSGHE